MIYVGQDASEIKSLLSKIQTRCIVAIKTQTDFGFAVTDSKTTKYKELVKALKKSSFTPGSYTYVRGVMTVTATKTDNDSGDVSGGIIELKIFVGEDASQLPKEAKLKQAIEVSNIIVTEGEEIPNSYAIEFKQTIAKLLEEVERDELIENAERAKRERGPKKS